MRTVRFFPVACLVSELLAGKSHVDIVKGRLFQRNGAYFQTGRICRAEDCRYGRVTVFDHSRALTVLSFNPLNNGQFADTAQRMGNLIVVVVSELDAYKLRPNPALQAIGRIDGFDAPVIDDGNPVAK
jgi:hypothetical protein